MATTNRGSRRLRRRRPTPNATRVRGIRWRDPLERSGLENAIELEAEDVAAATLYVDDAGIDTTEPPVLHIETTHDLTLTLKSGAGERTLEFPAGDSSPSVVLCERGPSA